MSARTRSSATVDQENTCIAEMRKYDPTTDDLRAAGVYQSSARIWGLRKRGYVINTTLYDGVGADGVWHCRMARYHLVLEPLPLDTKSQAETLCTGLEAQA